MSKKPRSSKAVSHLDYFLSDLKAVGLGARKYVTLNCMPHHFDFFLKPEFKIIIDAYIKTDIKESKRKLLFFFFFNLEFFFYFIFFPFIFISWRLITLQYCSGFCHTLT